MKDEPIYYINQFSVFRRPRIWSKRRYWTYQIAAAVIGIPMLAIIFAIDSVPVLLFLTVVLLTMLLAGAYNFREGRQRAERYKMELATGGPTIFYGKYPLNEVGHLPRL